VVVVAAAVILALRSRAPKNISAGELLFLFSPQSNFSPGYMRKFLM
jgi:hypothetical protein